MRFSPLFLIISLASLAIATLLLPFSSGAQVPTCSGTVPITNGDFEAGTVQSSPLSAVPEGWSGTGVINVAGPDTMFPSGSRYVVFGNTDVASRSRGGTISQSLTGSWIAGGRITFTVTSKNSGTIAFNGLTQSIINGNQFPQGTTHDFQLPATATDPLLLSLSSSSGFSVDSIRGTYVTACPPETSPTAPPVTPTPYSDPVGQQALTFTIDPRVSFSGSVAANQPRLTTFALQSPQSGGTVVVQTRGTFVYTSTNVDRDSDEFTVLATAPRGTTIITVTLFFEVEPDAAERSNNSDKDSESPSTPDVPSEAP